MWSACDRRWIIAAYPSPPDVRYRVNPTTFSNHPSPNHPDLVPKSTKGPDEGILSLRQTTSIQMTKGPPFCQVTLRAIPFVPARSHYVPVRFR